MTPDFDEQTPGPGYIFRVGNHGDGHVATAGARGLGRAVALGEHGARVGDTGWHEQQAGCSRELVGGMTGERERGEQRVRGDLGCARFAGLACGARGFRDRGERGVDGDVVFRACCGDARDQLGGVRSRAGEER